MSNTKNDSLKSGSNEIIEPETWEDIPSLNNLYQISNYGRVFSKISNKILVHSNDEFGYCRVSFRKFGLKMVHKLVAELFLETPPFKNAEINHKDKNPKNNFYKNLEWVTSRENSTHRWIGKNKSSQYTGVSWDKGKNKWRSTIYVNGKQLFLGRFENELEASQAYNNKLSELNEQNKYLNE